MTSDPRTYTVVVFELDDVVPRIRTDRPNLFVGVTSHNPSDLVDIFAAGKGRPAWVRGRVVAVRGDLSPSITVTRDEAVELKKDAIRRLRTRGFTVNQITAAYRTYVINLHNPKLADPGKGYVYVGQTSITPEERLAQHLTGGLSSKGRNLASRVVKKYGKDLNYELMVERIYLTKKQAEKAERRLADRLREEGYVVEGGH